MKCLHLASFIGNIGDNASHQGFYSILDTFLPEYSIEQVEIRRLYKNYQHADKLKFDENFIAYINTFDLFIIGGGGFLDYWVEGSQTGTTLDVSPALVEKIKVPTLITSVGCMPNKHVPEGNIEKFRVFLDAILSNPKIKLAVRNDGSLLSIEKDIGKHYLDYIPEVLDSGFFYKTSPLTDFPVRRDYAAINITSDQLRMASGKNQWFDVESYYQELAESVEYLISEQKLDVVFVPHIYSDLEAITELSKRLDNYLLRSHVSVAPSVQSDTGANYLFSIYQQSRLVLATRFHASVCNINMGKPTIGLSALSRVEYMYSSIGLEKQCVPLVSLKAETLKKLFVKTLNYSSTKSLSNKLITSLKADTVKFYNSNF